MPSQLPVLVLVLAATMLGVADVAARLYWDNGVDQTLVQRTMTEHEKLIVEGEILDLLDLPARPRRRRPGGAAGAAALNRSAPLFLMDAYNALGEDAADDQTTTAIGRDMALSGEDLQAIGESDVIMTFQSKSHHGVGMRHEKSHKHWFDISGVPLGDTIFNAEFRIYQKATNLSRDYGPDEIFTISVHKIESYDHDSGLQLELVASKNTTASKVGWIEINVTTTFVDWVAFPDQNNGLYVTVHPHSRPHHEMKTEDIGLVNAKGEDDKQPFMVAYLKASTDFSAHTVTRRKRQASKPKKSLYPPDSYRNPLINPHPNWNSKSCKIQTLYVSFIDLKWEDWIIAPEGYGAFYCSGECSFPLNAHMNATNHAIIQALVTLLSPNKVPKPCCAPTKLSAISVLYYLDDTNVMLKKYKNMVVKSCGCH